PKNIKIKIVKNNILIENTNKLLFLSLIEKIKNSVNKKIKKKLIIQGLGYKVYNKLLLDNTVHFKFGLSHNKILLVTKKNIEIKFFKIKRVINKINVFV